MCAAEVAAAITWGVVPLGAVLQTPCGNVDPKLMGSMSMVKRTCSQEGVWGELDFSKCTLSRRANPFLLVWVAVQGESLLSMEAVMQLKQEVRYHRFFLQLLSLTFKHTQLHTAQLVFLHPVFSEHLEMRSFPWFCVAYESNWITYMFTHVHNMEWDYFSKHVKFTAIIATPKYQTQHAGTDHWVDH